MRLTPIVPEPDRVDAQTFEQSAPATLRELQIAMAELVSKLPGRITRAVDLQRALGVDKKLGWQLFTFINAEQPLDEIANVPGAASIRRILTAAGRRKVARSVTERAAGAFDRFETFMTDHGADRLELVTLASGLSAEGDQQHELRVRKGLFRGTAHVWGVQAATYIRTCIVHPSASRTDATDDVLVMIGHIGLQRLRRGAPLALNASVGVFDEPASNGSDGCEQSAHPEAEGSPAAHNIGRMRVLHEFSSHPLPEMVVRTDADGTSETEVMFPPSGRSGAVTLYTTQFIEAAWTGLQSQHCLNTMVKLPAETHVSELLVPSGTTDPGTARVGVYGRRGAVDRVHELRAIDLLPQRESTTYMGALKAPPPLPGVPNHSEAVRHMLQKLGWSDTTFDVYRCTVRYPVLHTMIRLAVLVTQPE